MSPILILILFNFFLSFSALFFLHKCPQKHFTCYYTFYMLLCDSIILFPILYLYKRFSSYQYLSVHTNVSTLVFIYKIVYQYFSIHVNIYLYKRSSEYICLYIPANTYSAFVFFVSFLVYAILQILSFYFSLLIVDNQYYCLLHYYVTIILQSALQIRADWGSVTANLWPLTAHIYHIIIIMTVRFFKKSFFLLFPRNSFEQFELVILEFKHFHKIHRTSLFSFHLFICSFFAWCFVVILCINAVYLFVLFHCV